MNDRHRLAGLAGGPVALEKADGSNGPVIHRWWCYDRLLPRRARRVSPALWLHNAYPAIELKGDSLRIFAIRDQPLSSTPRYANLRRDTQRRAKMGRGTQRF